jgi:DNA-binding transcriptional MerR regulator
MKVSSMPNDHGQPAAPLRHRGHLQWTIDDLVDQVAATLATGYGGQASGRVRDLPDRRAVRWYQTLGLVDRPAGWRGRTALYGRRHLLQLVAIKRLQAAGHTLADIQVELTGVPEARLRQLAGIDPGDGHADDAQAPPPPAGAGPRRFGAARAGAAAATSELAAAAAPADGAAGAARWRGVQLGEGVILLLAGERELDENDLRDLEAAAAPLLAALGDRGLAPQAPVARPRAAPAPERTDAP